MVKPLPKKPKAPCVFCGVRLWPEDKKNHQCWVGTN
jgi:hypothetical protein